jgi:hypothetical protein
VLPLLLVLIVLLGLLLLSRLLLSYLWHLLLLLLLLLLLFSVLMMLPLLVLLLQLALLLLCPPALMGQSSLHCRQCCRRRLPCRPPAAVVSWEQLVFSAASVPLVPAPPSVADYRTTGLIRLRRPLDATTLAVDPCLERCHRSGQTRTSVGSLYSSYTDPVPHC